MTPGNWLTMSESVDAASSGRRWRLMRRFGAIGFWFFLLKGCIWLLSIGAAFVFALE